MFTFQLRGKHCWHPIVVMGVADTFRPRQFKSLVVETDFIYKSKRISTQKKTSRSHTADKYTYACCVRQIIRLSNLKKALATCRNIARCKKDYCSEYLLTEQIDILHAKLLGFENKWVCINKVATF